MILFVPMITDFILSQLSDFRHFIEPMTEHKIAVYELLIELCEVFGATSELEQCNKDLIGYVLGDLLPTDKGVVIKSVISKKKKQSSFIGLSDKDKCKLNHIIFPKACQALSAIIKAIGTLMTETHHKQIQCVLIGIGLERETTTGEFPNESKIALYETLILLLEVDHMKCPTSLQLLSHLFNVALQKEVGEIKRMCSHGMALCMKQIHSSRSSMHLDLPLEIKSMEEILKEMSKVHVYYLESSSIYTSTIQVSNEQISKEQELPTTSNDDGDHTIVHLDESESIAKKRMQEANAILDESKISMKKARIEHSNKENEIEVMEIPSKEEAESIVKEVYSMDNEPIVIPDNVKNLVFKVTTDKLKSSLTEESDQELSKEMMLNDFVPELKQ